MAEKKPLSDQQLLAIQADVLARFTTLQAAMATLLTQLRQENDYPAQVEQQAGVEARRLAITSYQSFYYEGDGKETCTTCWIGAVGASLETLQQAARVNTCKDDFKTAMAPLSGRSVMVKNVDPASPASTVSTPLARVVLERIGLKGIAQRHVTRHIPLLDERPRRLGFTKTKRSPSVERISLDIARRRLERLGEAPTIAEQLQRLDALIAANRHLPSARQEPLAIVNTVPLHVRCNVPYTTVDPVTGAPKQAYRQKKWSLPVLYPADAGDALLAIRWPTLPNNGNTSRGKRKIEVEKLLPDLNAHRYLPAYRHGDLRGATHGSR